MKNTFSLSITSLISLILFLSFSACTKNKDSSPTSSKPKSITVGLVLDKGGKDDKSFNSAAMRGANRAIDELGIELKDVESPDDSAFEPSLRTLAERGTPLVIAIGFSQKDAVQKVASSFPNTHFALVDAVVDLSNVKSLMFNEHEGSYLVGYLAGLATKTNVIGFIGGMDIALIKRFQMGFEAGLKKANAKAKLLTNYVGVTSDAWANPTRAKELALSQYNRNADIIFAAAGASNMGVFDAAEEKAKFAIGVDSNQNDVKPGRILTSMLKRVDTAVYEVIKNKVNSEFKPGVHYFGLADQGIDFSVDEHNEKLIKPYLEELEKIKADIISKKISVPDYYEQRKK